MALEPFVESNVYDLSGGLLPVPADTGYNIVMPVYTPAGPIEKTRVSSQKEFLDKYMTSSKIMPNDHISAQFAYVTLANNPVYLMRACPSALHEGMTSEGTTWLFDADYQIIRDYMNFKIDLSLDNSSGYSITSGSNTWSDVNSEDPGEEHEASFSELVDDIMIKKADSNGPTGNEAGILSTSDTQIISRVPLTATNTGKFDESVKMNSFSTMSFRNVNDGEASLKVKDSVAINGNTYEFLNTPANVPSNTANNTPIYFEPMNPVWEGLCVLGKENCLSSLKGVDIMSEDGSGIKINFHNNPNHWGTVGEPLTEWEQPKALHSSNEQYNFPRIWGATCKCRGVEFYSKSWFYDGQWNFQENGPSNPLVKSVAPVNLRKGGATRDGDTDAQLGYFTEEDWIKIYANVPIEKGTLGVLTNSRIRGKLDASVMNNGGLEDQNYNKNILCTYISDIKVGDIILDKNAYYYFAIGENDISYDILRYHHDGYIDREDIEHLVNRIDSALAKQNIFTVANYSGDGNHIDGSNYPDADELDEYEVRFSHNYDSGDIYGPKMIAKYPGGVIKYFDLSNSNQYISNGVPDDYNDSIVETTEGYVVSHLGKTAIEFTEEDGVVKVFIAPVTSTIKESAVPSNFNHVVSWSTEEGTGTFVGFDTPIIDMTADIAGHTFHFLNSDEYLAKNVNYLSALGYDDNLKTVVKSCGTSVEFVTSCLSDILNSDGAAYIGGEEQIPGTNVPSGVYDVAFNGSLDLFVPSYSTADVNTDSPAISLIADADVGNGVPTYYYSISAENNDEKVKFDKIQVTVGDTLYYVGEAPIAPKIAKLSDGPCDETEFLALLQKALLMSDVYLYNGQFISTDSSLDVHAGECSSNCHMDIYTSVVTQNPSDTFAIVSKFPCSTALMRFNYTYDSDTKIVDLHFNYKSGIITEDWTMSFVPGVTDGYGIDQWYTRVQSDYFQVVPLNTEAEPMASFNSPAFGKALSIPAYDDQFAIDAIQKITDYEDGIQYEIISDAGICSPNLAKAINALTKKLWAVYPVSIPAYTNYKDVINYISATEIDNFEARAWAIADRIPVGTFSAEMPGSYKCINKMVEASRSGSAEFAPIAGLNHGTVGTVNLIQNWKKQARETLLDYRVCTLKGGITTPYYVNQNYTLQNAKSYMLEEQNVRMTNAAIHVVQTLAVNYLHELNTKRLRDKVQENVNKAIQDRLFNGKAYTPAQYMAVCDDSNNPTSVIEQNKLVISLYASFTPSIHYILIDHYIVSLDQITEGSV